MTTDQVLERITEALTPTGAVWGADRMLARLWQRAVRRDFPILLPALAADATGGTTPLTLDVTAAWACSQLSAKIIDDIEDGDEPLLGPGTDLRMLLSLATALLMASDACLSDDRDGRVGDRVRIAALIAHTSLEVIAGQAVGFAPPEHHPDMLDWAWRVTRGKGGVPYAAACIIGAMSAGVSDAAVATMRELGQNIGEMVQLLDDAVSFESCSPGDLLVPALPLSYALTVMEGEDELRVTSQLAAVHRGEDGAADVLCHTLEEMGAGRYLRVEMGARAERARRLLDTPGLREGDGLAALREVVTALEAGRMSDLVWAKRD